MSIPPSTKAAEIWPWYLNNICFNIRHAVEVLDSRSVCNLWSSSCDEMRLVVFSVSAAVPAPQQLFGGKGSGHTFRNEVGAEDVRSG